MATSPDFIRLASSSTRAVADAVLDQLSDAVLVIDARHKHLPVVLANAAARQALASIDDRAGLTEVPLARLLTAESIGELERAVDGDALSSIPNQQLIWRMVDRDRAANTAIKFMPGVSTQRLAMLQFSPKAQLPDVESAVDQLPINVLILDRDLKITYANAKAYSTASMSSEITLGSSAKALIPLSGVHPEIISRTLDGKHFHDDTLSVFRHGHPTRWFEVDIQPLANDAGRITRLAVLYSEVTDRYLSARTQNGGERRLLALTEHARDIMTIVSADGRVEYVSGGLRNSLGYSSEERLSNSIFEHMHADDAQEMQSKFLQLINGEIEAFSKEIRVRHKDGSYRWLESSYVSALNNPLIGGVVINSRDVTERKHAEFRLAQREEIFRIAADAVDGVIFEWDIQSGVVNRSRGVQEVLGVDPEDIEASIGAWQERVHPRDFVAARRSLSLALINGRGWTLNYRIRDARGRYKSMLERGLILRNAAGDPVRGIGCAVDVSEIQRLTDLLADTQRTAKIGGWEYSFATRELTWTDELYRIFGANRREFETTWESMLDQCLPEAAVRLREALARAEAGNGQIDLEIEINTLAGLRLWVRLIGHMEMLEGQPFRAYGSLQDIQAQKLSQIALENSTGWLKLSMNMAHLHAWRWDRARDAFEFTSLEGQKIHLPSLYPGMETMLAKVHPQDQAAVKRAIDLAFSQHVEVREEFRLQGLDGSYRSYTSTARPLFDGESPRGLVGVIQDITGQRDNERRLRESEELLRNTTANTADTLFLVDAGLCVRFISRDVNGMSAEEIIGKDVGILLPEAARGSVLERLRKILATGETATYEFESLQAGQTLHFENHAVVIREDGIGTGISISMRDITERKRLEQEILNVSTRERQSIGRDLHDGLGQELTGVALMLRGLATRIQARCPDVVVNVNEVVSLVNQSIETARGLARGLLPVSTETGGIGSALSALAVRTRELYGLPVSFQDEIAADFAIDETGASHLYRITQEALTNAVRHGRASRVDIVLTTSASRFALHITDDGQGFSPASPSSGMGLKIMKYRAGMIGAQFEVETHAPRGTVIKVISERPVPGSTQSETAISGDNNDGSQQRMDTVVGISSEPVGTQYR